MGEAGEVAALAHLRRLGYRIRAVDWRCAIGQIDIVAVDGDTLVIVEVKARRGTAFGLPQEAVDARKQQKLRSLTAALVATLPRPPARVRIDVIGILLDEALDVRELHHIIDAVGG